MPYSKVTGIVTRYVDYKENDRILSIFGVDICKCPLCSSEMYIVRHREACLLC